LTVTKAIDAARQIARGRAAAHGRNYALPRRGGELEQIQFLLGHVSVETTGRYRDCTQRIASK